MLSDISGGLELRQADAVARALMTDDLLRAGRMIGQFCQGCGGAIGAVRLAMFPSTTRCSICAGSKLLAKGH
ncbi:hypothetical protein [Pseudomonas sp. PE-S1G-1]|uniref:hypothetical protein n=1 Tax=Pseudomonas sp. PE-S1G-1 TaxID=1986995 RepID=UPI000B3F817B|nr:hypothetical protein [Pseudomonas sp. PE-S1G-1]